eukprot:1209479-Amphidinium_carterae.1
MCLNCGVKTTRHMCIVRAIVAGRLAQAQLNNCLRVEKGSRYLSIAHPTWGSATAAGDGYAGSGGTLLGLCAPRQRTMQTPRKRRNPTCRLPPKQWNAMRVVASTTKKKAGLA